MRIEGGAYAGRSTLVSLKTGVGQIPEAISIRERPAEVEGPCHLPGHWRSDLLRGSGNSHIATLVERHSRFVLLDQGTQRTRCYGGGWCGGIE